MTFKLWVATIGTLLTVPVSALAQQSAGPANPADPRATIPAAVHESVVTNVSRTASDDNRVSPDKVWRAANDTVADTAGHAAHGGSGASANVDAHAGHVPAAQAALAPSPRPVPQPAVDHSKHH